MKKHILSLDFVLILIVSTLMSAGYLVLSSATNDTRRLTVQAISMILGRILMIVCAFWDFKSVKENKNYIYVLALFLLLIVFPFGIGKEDKGALSWIRFGGIGFQPSEFAKLLFSLYISFELTEMLEQKNLNNPKELLIFLLKCIALIGLVILQNDTGTALVFVFMLITTLFVAGIKLKYITIGGTAWILSLPLIWLLLSGYQKDRILAFLHPEADLSDSGFQVYLSKLALSSGGVFGSGYKNGAVNALSYLPEKETDFIFPIIGEEFGLFGTLVILSLFFLFILRSLFIAKNSESTEGKLLATSLCSMFLFHIVENIAMTTGLLPVTGIPLPFMSYGGSSILTNSIGVGLLLSVRRKTYTLYHI